MGVYESTAVRNQTLTTYSVRDLINRSHAVINIYSGSVPATADAAVTGTLLCTITNNGASVKAAQKIRFTPTIGTANGGIWTISLNGTSVSYTGTGAPETPSEVCTGLYNAWRVASGAIAVTTPACTINNPDVYQNFTFTDNTGTLDIEAAVAGTYFDYSATVSGAGAGTGSWTTSVITADAYGLRFEAAGDVSGGILEKLATQTWKGTNVATGVASHFRLVLDGDTGTASTSECRWQGLVSTANAELNFRSVQFEKDDEQSIGNDFKITAPAS